MNTNQLEKFAQAARRQLHAQVAAKLDRVLTTDSAALRAQAKAIQELKDRIAARSREAVIEAVAYTWFNRFCALRYMDANHYTRVGTVSPAPGHTQPEILQEAKHGVLDDRFERTVDMQTVTGLLSGRLPSADPQQEAYRLLLVGVCNAYHSVMPFMFERIDDYTELLMPDDLLSAGSILQAMRDALTEDACADVEVIGWLYQFYISEKKDAVMARKSTVPSADIPAVTQLFTPHWIVRYMVENSLGRLWMLNHPGSRLVERMDYYIPVDGRRQTGEGDGELRIANCELRMTNDELRIANDEKLTAGNYPRITSPGDIRLCDPAVGSGHILTYAFDLLYAIYEEEGYNPVDIPRLILEKNLTGIEIDPRAGALAGFALTMKAREKDRRFLRRNVQPGICVLENVTFAPDELDAYMDAVGRDLFTQHVQDWLQQFEQATTFGSLIRPLVTDTAFIRERLDEAGTFQNLFLSHTHDKLRAVLRMTDALSPRYHVVVANPPYMGNRNQSLELKDFLKEQYADVKSDLFSAFIVRNLEMALPQGQLGFMTPFVWMFISIYEDLRRYLIDHKTITSLVQLEYSGFAGATVPICTFTLENSHNPNYEGGYVRLSEFRGSENQAPKTREAIANPDCGWFYHASAANFEKIPGVPIAYWLSRKLVKSFTLGRTLGDLISVRGGMTTADNARFVRLWHEISMEEFSHPDSIQNNKWFPYNKGGQYRKWFGNRNWVVNWKSNGADIKSTGRASVRSEELYLSEMIGWTDITSFSQLGVRYYGTGFLFDASGPAVFPTEDITSTSVLGFLGSKITSIILQALNATFHVQAGNIASLPWLDAFSKSKNNLHENVSTLVSIASTDWNSSETSWDFTTSPLISVYNQDVAKKTESSQRNYIIPTVYFSLRTYWQSEIQKMQNLEEENNRIFIEAYGLQDELTPDVPLSEITLTCNPYYRYGSSRLKARNWDTFCERFPETCRQLAAIAAEMAPAMPEDDRLGLEQRLLEDTMKEFVSYAVGCMFGRYSLDKPGLVLANQGETVENYVRIVNEGQVVNVKRETSSVKRETSSVKRQTSNVKCQGMAFMPDVENVLPVLEGEWFSDDVTARFREFLRVTFGEEHYEENLAFIELALGRDIQGYFRRDFYKDHVQTYHQRPIYWLFSSPNGSFQALVYMHRYRPDTVSVVLNDYVREFRAKLAARKAHLEHIERTPGTPQRDKTQAVKEIAKIDKTLHELQVYEDSVLYPLAMQQVEIDLDDGVAVNYEKLGKALARI